MKTRIKSNEMSIATRSEFEAEIDSICRRQLELEARVVARDAAIAKVRDRHDPEIEAIKAEIEAGVLRCERFAATHRESLFGKVKSAATALADYGFRLGNPTLALLNRKWTWSEVLLALRNRDWERFIVIKESPDKEAMKSQLTDEQLAAVGTRIVQGESFYIEPKRDGQADTRISVEQI